MPTANLTWTNQSTTDSPTATKVERSDGFPFGHDNADPPVILANDGTTTGLIPTVSAGSYADTITGDASYAYRITTVKGSEEAAGIPTAMEYVYDPVNDLGYPLGAPSTAATYNVSTAPFLHVDVNRSSTGYASGDGMTAGFGGIIRHTEDTPWTFSSNSYSSAPSWHEEDLGNGNVRKFLHNITQDHANIVPPGEIACADGITVFAVVTDIFYDFSLSEKNSGTNAFANGHFSTSGTASSSYFNMMGSASTYYTLSNPGYSFANGVDGGPIIYPAGTTWDRLLHIMAWRINNSADAFNPSGGLNYSGVIKGQAFDGGNLLGTTPDVVANSYHNGATIPDITNDLMAGGFHPDYGMSLIFNNPSSYSGLVGEIMYFDSALDVTDMNTVFAYLGNKYEHSGINIIPASGSGSLHN
jgi:hypothetical protein